uniref:FYVE-type domain-containing protein n=1 Tax=Globisporangium ultimum (strain ATCC 200006 / CBS 805.95 / DAOM BR144) TaxID=431595 RepID=K3WFX5_GLOUD
MPPVQLPPVEFAAVEEEADRLVQEAINAYEEYRAMNRQFPRRMWRRVKSRGPLTVFCTRSGFETDTPFAEEDLVEPPKKLSRGGVSVLDRLRAATMQVDRLTQSQSMTRGSIDSNDSLVMMELPSQQQQMTQFVMTGVVPGTMEDAAYGNIADNPAVWRLRSTYTQDLHHDCKILTTLRHATKDDPFRFLGVKWSLKNLGALLKWRDMVYTESAGVFRDEQGKIHTGYNLMHSIELPGVIPQLTQYGVMRMQLSCCFVTRRYDENSIEIFCRAFVIPNGFIADRLAALLYAEALLVSVNVIECANNKKLMWMAHQRRRNNIQYTNQTLATATHCQMCLRGLKILGNALKRSATTCQCCKRILCGKCKSEREVIVDLTQDGGVTQKALPFCMHCVIEAQALPAEEIAILTT